MLTNFKLEVVTPKIPGNELFIAFDCVIFNPYIGQTWVVIDPTTIVPTVSTAK